MFIAVSAGLSEVISLEFMCTGVNNSRALPSMMEV